MAINNVSSKVVSFKGDQEQQRSSGPGLGTIAATTIVGGGIGVLARGRKASLEGLDKDAFIKATADFTGDDKANADAVKAYFDKKDDKAEKAEKSEGKSEKAEAKGETKGTKTAKPSVAAGGITTEKLFGNAEEIDPMKYLQEKYGYGTVEELMNGLKDERIKNGSKDGKALRSAVKSGTRDQARDEKVFSKVEQGIKQEIAIKELEQKIAEEEFKVEGMVAETKAEIADKAIAQRRVDTMKKTLQNQQERLAKFNSDMRDNKAYQKMKQAFYDEGGRLMDEKSVKKALNATKDAGLHAKNEITDKIKADAGKKAEKAASKKGLKGTERQEFIQKAQDEAVAANKERIDKYVQLQREKEFHQRARNELSNNFKSFKRETSLETKKSVIGSQRELSKLEASILEMEKDLELIRAAKKGDKKITKAQAQEVMDAASAKAKEGVAKVAKEAGEKAGKAGEEAKGSIAESAAKALEAIKKKLPNDLTKFNTKAMVWGGAIGLAAGLVIKWMFGGKSEE